MKRFVLLLLVVIFSATTLAQDGDSDIFGYFIAPDANGIGQIWSVTLDDGADMLTQSAEAINTFDVADDGSAITYNTQDNVYFQVLDGSEPVAVATLTSEAVATLRFADPVLSPDNSRIAYTDNGLYVVEVDGGEPTLLVENNTNMEDIDNWRFMFTGRFISTELLLAQVGIWESTVPALVNITTGEITEAPRYVMSRAVPLSDERLVLYNNSFIALMPGLEIATVATFSAPETLDEGAFGTDVIPTDEALVSAVAETAPGQLRVIVEWLDFSTEGGEIPVLRAIVDYDIETGTGTFVQEPASDTPFASLVSPQLSSDGQYVAAFEGFNDSFELENWVVFDVAADTIIEVPNMPDGLTAFSFAG